MNNKISNPLLKQLISEIANKANEGRITNLNWKSLTESKNILNKEADEKKKGGDPLDSILNDAGAEDASGGESAGGGKGAESGGGKGGGGNASAAPDGAAGKADAATTEEPTADVGAEESPEEAQADAAKKKAELEKAKAEKAQAEEELEKQSYVKLKSSGGTQFMLDKILSHAFKTNTIDALAAEMAQKLKITTPEDAAAFSEDMALYRNIPGMADLLASIKTVAVQQPEKSTEEPTA